MYSSSYPFPYLLSPPTGTNWPPPLGRAYSALLFSDFVEEKNIKDKKGNIVLSCLI
jgi:hypothetical protein